MLVRRPLSSSAGVKEAAGGSANAVEVAHPLFGRPFATDLCRPEESCPLWVERRVAGLAEGGRMQAHVEGAPPRSRLAGAPDLEIIEATPDQRTDRGSKKAESSGLRMHERLACSIIASGPTPRHVAFIMDGNRRFAREHGWEVAEGHRRGYDKLEEALRWCCELGVHGVTVYAFSIENFKRSEEEVAALMALTEEKLRAMSDEEHIVQRRGVRVRVVGDLTRVSDSLRGEMRRVMRMTQGNTKHTLTVCFSYTSRNEIAASVRRLAGACADGRLEPEDVSSELIERCLLTSSAALPPVDLIVRTSGERRLSDFLLWQSATCAVSFTRVLWPELSLIRFLGLLLRFQLCQPYMSHVSKALKRTPPVAGTTPATAPSSSEPPARSSRQPRAGARLKRAASSAISPLLLLLATGCLTASGVAIAMRALGQPTSGAVSIAAACLTGWLLIAWAAPLHLCVGNAAPPAPPATAARGVKGDGGAAVELPADVSPAATNNLTAAGGPVPSRRVREFLADVNVDRLL